MDKKLLEAAFEAGRKYEIYLITNPGTASNLNFESWYENISGDLLEFE